MGGDGRHQEPIRRDQAGSADALRRFVELAPGSMAMFDNEMKYVAASEAYRMQHELGDLALVGRSHYDVFPELPDRWRSVHRAALAGQHCHQEEDFFVRRNGAVQWVDWDMCPWFGTSGDIGGAILTTADAGPRRRLRQLQASQERLYQQVFEQAVVGIAILDLVGRIERCNPALVTLLAQGPDRLMGHEFTEFLQAEDRAKWLEGFGLLARREAREALVECRGVAGRGGQKWIYASLSMLSADDVAAPRIIVMAGDRTERHLAAIELHRREHMLQSLMQTASDSIVLMDGKGLIVSANPATEKLFGYSAAELMGRNVAMLAPPGDSERHGDYLAHYHATHERRIIGQPRALTARRKDGTLFPIRLAVAEVDHMGVFVGFMHDMSSSVALREEILSVASMEQQRIGQELHDATQQELTGLALLAQSLADRLGALQASPGDRGLARQLVEGLTHTQKSVQDIARGLLPVPIDAASLPVALAALADSTTRAGTLRCLSDCSELPSGIDAERATHLYRIAQEALGNAVRHSQASQVSIQLLAGRKAVTLKIEDNGTGLGASARSGRGLGLRLMGHRCSLAGGQLTIGTPITGGTFVACRIPVPGSSQP